jgi:hypothetical protein
MTSMDESRDTGDQSADVVGSVRRAGVDRRTMLKAAVAAGAFAGTWVAPRIETFGFAPAAAATLCTITNDANDDLNSNESDNTYVSTGRIRCGDSQSQSFGNSGGQPDRIVFDDPNATCDKFVVRTIPEDCNQTVGDFLDPDLTGFAVVEEPSEHVGTGCDECQITQVVIYNSNRSAILATFTQVANPFPGCPGTGPGIRVVLPCDTPSNARLAVRITCTGVVLCPPAPPV